MGRTRLTPGLPPADAAWNYRVVRSPAGCGVHEVYYHADGTVNWVSAEAVAARGRTPDELADDLRRQAEALMYPPLELELGDAGAP